MRVTARVRICGLGIALAVAAGCDGDEAGSTTETDSTPPQVVSMSPAAGSAGIPTTSTVSATFSEAIDPSSVTTASFSVEGTSGTVSVSGATATFTPDVSLTAGTEYTATLTDAITDLAGNSLATPATWSFTTNVTPAADAGPDIDVALGEEVSLQASASDSDQGQAFTFTWAQVSGPDVGALSGEDPTFAAPGEVSTIELDLTVSDGVDTSPADRVVVRVLEDPADALWVSALQGGDGNPGTRAEPLATIQAAVDAADAAGTGADVYVAAGTYSESIALADMVSIYGGFSEAWVREIGAHETIVDGGTAAVTGSGAGGLTLDGLTIRSADATASGESSVGVAVDAGVDVVLSRNVITAGRGAPGTDRPSVLSAADGGPGDPGIDSGGGNGGSGTCSGGSGGDGGENSGSTGGAGLCGGGAGGAGAPGQDSNGQPGDPGGPGAPGTHGTSGEAFGSIAGGAYTPADGTDGTDGDPGSGGGGGGGGGGQSATGRSGGGGGGGGGGGEGGGGALGGGGGGGSFGALLSNGTTAVLEENTITTSDGGPGGDGGTGGAGGNGGGGGNGVVTMLGDGREGGDGGDGGDGGSGGGGGGGPTIGIVEDGSSSSNVSAGDLGDNEVTVGAPGTGGLHGDPTEDDGAEGESVPYKKN